MNLSIKTTIVAVAAALSLSLLPAAASAGSPYPGYIYSPDMRTPASLNGYVYADSIDGFGLSVGPFDSPEDLFVAEDDTLYIVDSGNARVVHLDREQNVLLVVGDEEGAGQLNTPKGVFATKDGEIYVADTGNRRIARFDAEGRFVQEYLKPDSPLLGEQFYFAPSKVAVDKRGYLFVVSEGASQGLLQIGPEGRFAGFFGANHVEWSLSKFLVKLIASREQRDQMASERPPEFSNVFEDAEGFYYTTTLGIAANQIKRLSTVGVDILNGDGGGGKEQNVYGDYQLPTTNYTPAFKSFVDVTASTDGIITALDSVTGKAYQYNAIKNMLFVFGGIGEQDGLFKVPSSIAETSDGTLYIADKGRNRIDRFVTTPFGQLVHRASILHADGKYGEAQPIWKEVLRMNANYRLAYGGIGQALLKSERYDEAMDYFKLAKDKYGYSAALAEYRKEVMRRHFGELAGGLIGALAAIRLGFYLYGKLKRQRGTAGMRTDESAGGGRQA